MTGIVNSTGAKSGIIGTTVGSFDDNNIQTNLALVAFKTAINGSLVKYDLKDQIIDEYINESGIDGTPSTNHIFTSGVYGGFTAGGSATGGDVVNTDFAPVLFTIPVIFPSMSSLGQYKLCLHHNHPQDQSYEIEVLHRLNLLEPHLESERQDSLLRYRMVHSH